MASVFTRIVKGEIPCYKVAEDDRYFAFLDINPLAKGHTLVIPKEETDNIFDLDDRTLADMMANNVEATYGSDRFPNMEICAKSGTAEVGADQSPHAWFAGFLRNEDAPYAFVVVVENGGSGNDVAGSIAARVLDALVNGY